MDPNMNIDNLRFRHKQFLVERAFNIFVTTYDNAQPHKDFWIERLVAGHDVRDFLEHLKTGNGLPHDDEPWQELTQDVIGRLRVIDENTELHAGLKRKLKIRLKNVSKQAFQTTPVEPVFLAYHWYRVNGEVYDFDGARTPLPEPVEPGQELEMNINLTPPAEPGEYQLVVTMVHEGRCWMEDAGLDVQHFVCAVQDYDGRGLSRHALSVFKQLQAAELEVMQ